MKSSKDDDVGSDSENVTLMRRPSLSGYTVVQGYASIMLHNISLLYCLVEVVSIIIV